MNGCNGVSRWSGVDVGVELFDVHQGHSLEYWRKDNCCSEGCCQLLLGENRTEVVGINGGIVAILPFLGRHPII